MKYFFSIILVCFGSIVSFGQKTLQLPGNENQPTDNLQTQTSKGGNDGQGFEKRNDAKDSLTIYYRKYNQFKIERLDSNINNFNTKFPLPNTYLDLGNATTAARSLIFNPIFTSGFEAGFHQYDVYNFSVQNSRLYNTTKPFTELAYLLGNAGEQLVSVLHTQNKKDNVNFSLEYRFMNAPGLFKSQNSSLNNLRFLLQYQSPNKRYNLFGGFISNKNASSENGGLADAKKLDSLSLGDPFELLTRLGPNNLIRRNPFSTTVYTGNTYQQSNFYIQHQYSFGQKDSIVKDSSVVKLFYPRIKLQHILSVKTNIYNFTDYYADSTNYQNYFGLSIKNNTTGYDTIIYEDKWNIISNELSVISYPDKKNTTQYLKLGAAYDYIKGSFNNVSNTKLYNFSVLGEYRNRTKNKIWDIEANSTLYISGYNKGDYNLSVRLQKLISNKTGSLEVGLQNMNRTPDFIYNPASSFLISNRADYNKENITKFWGNFFHSKLKLNFTAEYFVLSNYLYFDSFFTAQQDAALINVLHLGIEKDIKISKKIHWYTSLHLQQSTANAPLNIPTAFTNNRLVFEGNFYKNLFLATGLEVRYIVNYKPNGYSPFNGQFFYQNNYSTANKPDINFFFNFRIKTFKNFVRVENLNTLFSSGYKKYNFSLEQYPTQSLWMRFGVWWNFVN